MLKHGTKVHDLESHFVVDEGDGKPYRVAKHGLAHQTVEKIKRFAKGGQVQSYDQGGDVPRDRYVTRTKEDGPESAQAWADRELAKVPDPAQMTDQQWQDQETLRMLGPDTPGPGPIRRALSTFLPLGDPGQSGDAARQPGAAPEMLPLPAASAPAEGASVPDAAASAPSVTAPAPAKPAGPARPPGTPQELRDAQGLEQKATQELADTKERQFAQVAAQQRASADQAAQDVVQSQQMLQARTAKQEQLFNDLVNGKNGINPNHYWESRSTGQKISASIGLILGGIGAGLTKGPNFAMDVINKAIDRDMEAQKLTMQNRQNGLRLYMEQTKDLTAAQHALRSDMYTAAAAQLASAMSGMSGERAQAEGAQALAQLRTAQIGQDQAFTARAMQLKQEAAMHPLQLEQAQIGVRQARMGEQTQALTMQAIQQLTSGMADPGVAGAKLNPKAIEFLPPEYRSRLVPLPDGSYATARTPKDAEEVAKTQETTGVLRDKLSRYRALLDAHPQGISSTLSPTDTAKAEALRDSILTDINSLAGLQRFTHEEANVFRGRLPDITSKQLSKGHQAKLEELGKEIDDKVWGTNQVYLNIPRRRRPGG